MSEDTLEIMLVKLTNPLSKHPDYETIIDFCKKVEEDEEGPQMSLKFLAHKVQSPQEREALQALIVLDEIVKKSGPNLLAELGKFRFLNELIKTISPKYLGNRTSEKVKERIIELLFKWSVDVKKEAKIFEAYQMLKAQGIVMLDPIHALEHPPEPFQPPPPRPKSAVFEDEEKSKTLRKLLNSRKSEDLQAANRLIKNMVREADHRMELVERRVTELETVNNNAKVLADMLNCYKPGETSEEEKELMKELYESSLRLRPKLFRLAAEMDEKDEGLNDILKANDELTAVISQYIQVLGITEAKETVKSKKDESSLLDLELPSKQNRSASPDTSLLDDQLLALGLTDAPSIPVQSQNQDTLDDLGQIFSSSLPTMTTHSTHLGSSQFVHESQHSHPNLNTTNSMSNLFSSANVLSHLPTQNINNMPEPLQPVSIANSERTSINEKSDEPTKLPVSLNSLDALGQSLLKQSMPSSGTSRLDFPSTPQKIPMNQLQKQQVRSSGLLLSPASGENTNSVNNKLHDVEASPIKSPNHETLLPIDMFVPLETIQPGTIPPLTLPEKNGLTIVIHFGKDAPRPDITVMVVSTMNKNNDTVKSFSFQAAVPKSMKLKLQPPSATDLPAYNPILPPAAITQVMLLANPNKEKVRLKYKLTYIINEVTHSELGEVENLLGPR